MTVSNACPSGLDLLIAPERLEASMWRRFKLEGDESARSQLFDFYEDKARSFALGMFRSRSHLGLELKDFKQLAYEALLESLDRYEPDRGIRFEAFARIRMRGNTINAINNSSDKNAQSSFKSARERERTRSISVFEQEGESKFHQISEVAVELAIGILLEMEGLARDDQQVDPGPNRIDTLAFNELKQSLHDEVKNLSPPKDSIIKYHYLEGITFADIAAKLRLSKSRVSQLHKEALTRLRKSLKHFM